MYDDKHPNITDNPQKDESTAEKEKNDKKTRLSSHEMGDLQLCKITML